MTLMWFDSFRELDLPGVGPDDIDLALERNGLSPRVRGLPPIGTATRSASTSGHGQLAGQLLLGNHLDAPGQRGEQAASGVLGSADRSSDAPDVVARSVPACPGGRSRGDRAGPV